MFTYCGVGLSSHPQTAQFDPLEVGINVGCDNPTHSLLRPAGGGGQFGPQHTDGAVKTRCCATRENFTNAWVSRAQAWSNLTPNMARPTRQSSTYAQVNCVLLGGVDHTPEYVRSAHAHDFTCGGGVSSSGGSNCHIKMACVGRNITMTIRPYVITLDEKPGV
jgi:hypothetical protein